MNQECSVDGCTRRAESRTWCRLHYERWQDTGDTGPAGLLQRWKADSPICVIPDCGGKHEARGWCTKHYRRWKKHGDPMVKATAHHPRNESASYNAIHTRIRQDRGHARGYACVRCASRARDWAYDHSDPNELVDPHLGFAYSLDQARYVPMCKSCHSKFDRKMQEAC